MLNRSQFFVSEILRGEVMHVDFERDVIWTASARSLLVNSVVEFSGGIARCLSKQWLENERHLGTSFQKVRSWAVIIHVNLIKVFVILQFFFCETRCCLFYSFCNKLCFFTGLETCEIRSMLCLQWSSGCIPDFMSHCIQSLWTCMQSRL